MRLVLHKINSEYDFDKYLEKVESFNVVNPFYKIIGADVDEILDGKLKYFEFIDEKDRTLVIMPFLLRKIPDIGLDRSYYDVISPYGYSGPLYNFDLPKDSLIKFWEMVDDWYKKNNVVSEFIRFSLNSNYQFYSGVLIPTLSNVKGKIIGEIDQWDNFKQKVRNNYRKASGSKLRIEILQDSTNIEKIKKFHSIYIETMTRINAEAQYFYSLNYFKKTVELSKNNFLIAFVYYKDIAISTELILISGKTLFSYLGGTLAEYFNHRPNDFLKIEVMNWARKNNYENYILGGGRSDNDGLYQYKKAFFPNDTDIVYYTGRKITNKKVYNSLNKIMNSQIVNGDLKSTEESTMKIDYFPSYRAYELNEKKI